MQHVSLLSFTFYANSFPPIRTQSILLTLTSLVILFLIFPLDSTVVLQLPATPPPISTSTLSFKKFRFSSSILQKKCQSLGLITFSTSHTSSATFENLADISACRFIYNSLDGSLTEIPQERLYRGQDELP
jgi:hypothetical protein